MLNSINSNKLTEEESTKLEELINEKELQEAVKSLKNNKLPGIDRLLIEFYKLYWEYLKKTFAKQSKLQYNKQLPVRTVKIRINNFNSEKKIKIEK